MIVAAMLSFSTPAHALDDTDIFEVKSVTTDKGWTVRMFEYQKTRLFAFCSAERMYKSKGTSSLKEALLSFLLGDDVFGSVLMLFDSDISDVPTEFKADVKIDDFRFTANGGRLQSGENGLMFFFPTDGNIYRNMMSGRTIKYIIPISRTDEKFVEFDLDGSRKALEQVLNCVGGGAKANIQIQKERQDDFPHFPD